MFTILSYALTFIFTIIITPFVLLIRLGILLKIPLAKTLLYKLDNILPPDKDIRDAISMYGIRVGYDSYKVLGEVTLMPDMFVYILGLSKTDGQYLVFLLEDYVDSMKIIEQNFANGLGVKIIKLHTVHNTDIEMDFSKRLAPKAAITYSPPDDWNVIRDYAVDFPPFYFGFLATVQPKENSRIWAAIQHSE